MAPTHSSAALLDDEAGVVHVVDGTGAQHTLDALDGWRVMEIIRDHGLPIQSECGGACACATCHVHVDPDWTGSLHPATDEEEDMLDTVVDAGPSSRLACQIIWTPELNGLVVRLPDRGP